MSNAFTTLTQESEKNKSWSTPFIFKCISGKDIDLSDYLKPSSHRKHKTLLDKSSMNLYQFNPKYYPGQNAEDLLIERFKVSAAHHGFQLHHERNNIMKNKSSNIFSRQIKFTCIKARKYNKKK